MENAFSMDDMETLEKTLLGTKKQSRYGLIVLILKMCTEPKNRSDIYFGNPRKFTYAALSELISQCLKLQLLEEKDGKYQKYQTTAKGLIFIKKFEELLKYLSRSYDRT
jgi:predicted transcriptional regulator